MSREQPTEREAREAMRYLERGLALPLRQTVPNPVEWTEEGGFWIWNKGSRYPYYYKPILSDVSQRCHDCGKVLVERHNTLVRSYCERGWEDRPDAVRWYDPAKNIRLCLGCSNKRWPAVKALVEWNETRLACNRVTRVIAKLKKEQTNEQH